MTTIARRTLGSAGALGRPGPETRAYQVWLAPQQHQEVQAAIGKFRGEWSEWAGMAIQRLKREDDDELHSLLTGLRRTDKTGKQRLSFRVREDDFAAVQALAQKYKTSIQAVFSTAFSMEALALDLNAPVAG